MVLYGMIARQPVSQLWLAGIVPGLLMATMFVHLHLCAGEGEPDARAATDRRRTRHADVRKSWRLLRAGIIPFLIFFSMTGLFVMGYHEPGRKLGRRGDGRDARGLVGRAACHGG